MQTFHRPKKEQGVVLLLILGFMAMFAVMVLTFIMMTSNMSDSASESLAAPAGLDTVNRSPAEEVTGAIKAAILGTDNPNSPIGPFGILENLYGLARIYDPAVDLYTSLEINPDSTSNQRLIPLYPSVWPPDGSEQTSVFILEHPTPIQREIGLNAGSILTFDTPFNPASSAYPVFVKCWQETAQFSSAQIFDRTYNAADDRLEITVKQTPELTRFFQLYAASSEMPFGGDGIRSIRFNPPAFSGTGAGGFLPQVPMNGGNPDYGGLASMLDGQQNAGVAAPFRLSFADWSNAAAPDLTPYAYGDAAAPTINFRTFLKHLKNRDYRVFSYDMPHTPTRKPHYDSGWDMDVDTSNPTNLPTNPIRMNPSYTAPDGRTLFLAHYSKSPLAPPNNPPLYSNVAEWQVNVGSTPVNMVVRPPSDIKSKEEAQFAKRDKFPDATSAKIIPSFHRPDKFAEFAERFLNDDNFNLLAPGNDIDLTSIVRKMTPRPLPLDHWNFSGGNPGLSGPNTAERAALNTGGRNAMNEMARFLVGRVVDGTTYYGRLHSPVSDFADSNAHQNFFASDSQLFAILSWDVDNDGDGVNDGIWIPSGLPIRTNADGTPYATFYSFTILDMDGRVNVNTAGNWDQMPLFSEPNPTYNPYVLFVDHYDLLRPSDEHDPDPYMQPYDKLTNLGIGLGASVPLSPWYNVKDPGSSGLDLMDDMSTAVVNSRRGSGFGTAGLNLREALAKMKISLKIPEHPPATQVIKDQENKKAADYAAANILWNRYRDAEKPQREEDAATNYASAWNIDNRYGISQPANYQGDGSTQEIYDPQSRYKEFFTNTYRFYNDNSPAAVPENFPFPWRGKTSIPDYNRPWGNYPAFDYTDAGMRSYDPLGNDIITYPPRQSENPYLVNPYHHSDTDSSFGVAWLEVLLRSRDPDIQSLKTELIEDLANNVSPDNTELQNFWTTPANFDDARLNLTTISSDIPVPAQVFPFGPPEADNGAFTLRELIRRCVFVEFCRRNLQADPAIFDSARTQAELKIHADYSIPDGDPIPPELTQELDNLTRQNREMVIYPPLSDTTQAAIDQREKIDDLVEELFGLLPPEIQRGERLDLNRLSKKPEWIDQYVLEDSGNVHSPYRVANEGDHIRGLIDRMEFARGLYVLMMLLTYEDRNAQAIVQFHYPTHSPTLADYVEGMPEDFKGTLKKPDGTAMASADQPAALAEWTANRIAQWCVNVVDFSDPDATMTPFFFDPNPFDGWWTQNNDWMTSASDDRVSVLPPNFGTYTDAQGREWSRFEYAIATPDSPSDEFTGFRPDGTTPNFDANFIDTTLSYAKNIAHWLEGKDASGEAHTPSNASNDFGFRQVWGMERPDLLLTETLSFHDLGVAEDHKVGQSSSDDKWYQVRRPQGSTYLELYCAANPNIPQSPELYHYDSSSGQWNLRISKMTPRIPNSTNSEYENMQFPIWRVAISGSSWLDGASQTYTPPSETTPLYTKRVFQHQKNSLLERLIGSDNDFLTFSLQTQQFNGTKESASAPRGVDQMGKDTNNRPVWYSLDLSASNILGPVYSVDSSRADYSQEVEIDRIVWFGNPTDSGGDLEPVENFPDSSRIFWRVNVPSGEENFDIAPNRYLVVGPEQERSIGSYTKSSIVPTGDPSGYYGARSANKIDLTTVPSATVTMEIGSSNGLGTSGSYTDTRGLNISEPLWETEHDPYSPEFPAPTEKDVKVGTEDMKFDVTLETSWSTTMYEYYSGSNTPSTTTSPIVQDVLNTGTGTVAGYKSAFVQRVADPNRPYHPLTNPYRTVDWNMMDLTVFNGEALDDGGNKVNTSFAESTITDRIGGKSAIGFSYSSGIFSSREWMNEEQKGFYPNPLQIAQSYNRPNLWARPLLITGGLATNGGLENGTDYPDPPSGLDFVVKVTPTQRLGETPAFSTTSPYSAPPPFEHLVWNDAPFSNPAEVALVPASSAARFGLEFIRTPDPSGSDPSPLDLSKMIPTNPDAERRSLGSGDKTKKNPFGYYYKPTSSDTTNEAFIGPYMNFFNSVAPRWDVADDDFSAGQSLNLAKVFDFVTIPSRYYGTSIPTQRDANGKITEWRSTLREPGKVNINTLREPAWTGLLGSSATTDFDTFGSARLLDSSGSNTQKVPFQPAHTAALKANLSLAGSNLSLFSQNFNPSDPNTPEMLLNRYNSSESNTHRGNLRAATDEIQKLSGLTTNRSNVFAIYLTVGYFEVAKAQPGINMPTVDPDGNAILTRTVGGKNLLDIGPTATSWQYKEYYEAIYPDGYTYGRELGSGGMDQGGVERHRAFYLLDRSIPVDFRRGQSWNWRNAILLERQTP